MRKRKALLSPDRIAKLDAIGFEWYAGSTRKKPAATTDTTKGKDTAGVTAAGNKKK
jgi:hypothetical protein